jgi:hypothetical protein
LIDELENPWPRTSPGQDGHRPIPIRHPKF